MESKKVKLSHEWDNRWDIKDTQDAISSYLRLKDKLKSIPEKLSEMERLAKKDGFELPEDIQEELNNLVSTKLDFDDSIVLIKSDAHSNLFGESLFMYKKLYETEFTGNSFHGQDPKSIVDQNGDLLIEVTFENTFTFLQVIKEGKFTILPLRDYDKYLEESDLQKDQDDES